MNTYYTYLYIDPKNNSPIYVGKGQDKRAWSHFTITSNPRLTNTLKKRIQEGFIIEPSLTYYPSEKAAYSAEIFWIAVYGREDLKTGTLFNRTPGGDAPPSGKGRKRTEAWIEAHRIPATEEKKAKQRLSMKGRYKGRPAYNKGIPCSEEKKKKISETALAANRISWNKDIPMYDRTKSKLSESKTKYQFNTPNGIFNIKREMVLAFPEFTIAQLDYYVLHNKNGFSRTLKPNDV